jgi:hypothetical protein
MGMHFFTESENTPTLHVSSTPRFFSPRGLAISLLERMRWCGLCCATRRPTLAKTESNALTDLATCTTLGGITAAIAKRQHIAQSLRKAGAPQVGLFWYIQKPGRAPELLASGAAVQQGKAYGMYIYYREDHAICWHRWKRCLPTFFHNTGPEDWPRGRVLFTMAMKHFEVDVCGQLLTSQRETEIIEYFSLPKASTVFHADPHYAASRFMLGPEGPREVAPLCASKRARRHGALRQLINGAKCKSSTPSSGCSNRGPGSLEVQD